MMLGNMGRELIDIITFYMRKAAATGTLQMKMMTAAIGKPKAGATVALVFLGNALAAKLFHTHIGLGREHLEGECATLVENFHYRHLLMEYK